MYYQLRRSGILRFVLRMDVWYAYDTALHRDTCALFGWDAPREHYPDQGLKRDRDQLLRIVERKTALIKRDGLKKGSGSKMTISQSIRGCSLPSATLTKDGFSYDRKFMLLRVHDKDSKWGRYQNMHVTHYPEMVLFHTSIKNSTLHVTYRAPGSVESLNEERPTLEIELSPSTFSNLEKVKVDMHKSVTTAYNMGSKYNEWFTRYFGFEVILAYAGSNRRLVLGNLPGRPATDGPMVLTPTKKLLQYVPIINSLVPKQDDEKIAFNDCAPYLVITEASCDDVSSRLPSGTEMDITKFRANIIVSGSPSAFDEDYWGGLTFGGDQDKEIILTANCGRCVSLNVDHEKGTGAPKGEGVLKLLMKDRRVDEGVKYSPIFGRYGFVGTGDEGKVLRVGDEVRVSKRNEERTKFSTGKEFTTCLAAHRRLGPVIRIGPREISIDCIEDGVRTVYGGNWDKSSMYDNFTQFGFSPLFAIRQAKPHSERRRVFTHIYSKSTIMNSAELYEILSTIGRNKMLPRLQKSVKEGDEIDVYSLTREYSMDVVTTYVYGKDNGTNWVEHPDQASYYLSAFQRAVEPWAFFASTETQRLVSILDWFGINLISPSVNTAFDTIHSFVMGLTKRTVSILENDDTSGIGSMNSFSKLWQRLENVPDEQKVQVLASDLVDQIHAGHQATGVVLTYLMWELSRNPEVQDRLRNDLRSLSDPLSSKFLDAVLMETMRLYPAGFGPFPRIAPDHANVKGFTIPKGTIATASPYTLGRNINIFPRADSWLPERWLEASDTGKREMRQWVWMFMNGARNCIGEHLAVLAMKAFIVDVYTIYGTTITGNPGMRQLEAFFSIPENDSLFLQFQVV
ncbi:hypothetical protein NHQ30_004830 [Ciborinia camelliae]|nr:hypothetical protein NHQ30_004830 [Ciborinia camelliae]